MIGNRFAFATAAALLLISCAGSGAGKPPEIINPYIGKAQVHTSNGISALQQERWEAAERSFSRALVAAQLADAPKLIARAWYNLATAQRGARAFEQAETAFDRAIDISQRNGDRVMRLRALLALRLMQQHTGRLPQSFSHKQLPETLFSKRSWPTDLHLQAGRLAQRLGDAEAARAAYDIVASQKAATRSSLKLHAEAHMGLAILARDAGKKGEAWHESEEVLKLCRDIGAPRLSAHALMLQAAITPTASLKQDRLERALDIYSALDDLHGQQQALEQLLALARQQNKGNAAEQLQLRLHQISDMVTEQQ